MGGGGRHAPTTTDKPGHVTPDAPPFDNKRARAFSWPENVYQPCVWDPLGETIYSRPLPPVGHASPHAHVRSLCACAAAARILKPGRNPTRSLLLTITVRPLREGDATFSLFALVTCPPATASVPATTTIWSTSGTVTSNAKPGQKRSFENETGAVLVSTR